MLEFDHWDARIVDKSTHHNNPHSKQTQCDKNVREKSNDEYSSIAYRPR